MSAFSSLRASGQTPRSPGTSAPLLRFLRTETASAAYLLAATILALLWANAAPGSYTSFWHTHLSLALGSHAVSLDLREWVNSGLMTLFFFIVGLETRREFDLGEFRERMRITLPTAAGLAGMLVPLAVYLAFTHDTHGARGWGTVISTDTAFALGMYALVGRRLPAATRAFVLTTSVVDDFVALAVIAIAYTSGVSWPALFAAIALFAVGTWIANSVVRVCGEWRGAAYALTGLAVWFAMLASGVDPVVTGLALGLMACDHPARGADLRRASLLYLRFREQPTPGLERSARRGLAMSVSLNARLQQLFHPWTSYVIVPVFALANAGITVNASQLSAAFTSAITLGIIAAYVIGKPLGMVGGSALTTWLSRGRLRPPVGWGAVAVGGTISGIGFTIALLIANRAFEGRQLAEAKIGILCAVLLAFVLTWLVTLVLSRLPRARRRRALLGKAQQLEDLAEPVDPGRDHIRGPHDAMVTVVEYGDFECPYCGEAEPVIRDLLADFGDVRYVWRHLPLSDVHPNAVLAARATEAAAVQERFWEMHDQIFAHPQSLDGQGLVRLATAIELDMERFRRDLDARPVAVRVAEDAESADLSNVSGTPTFFINGRRHYGAYDIETLSAAVRTALERAKTLRHY
ncbi:Na+/H+ antiporter NhaA [Streptomyces sp. NPDC058691]|uniref:Na+/H+ antiporter NhaA n=1 Tax=Streptomyces sp. NPDC058691 TaxID=3346601 RepID=UPI00365929D3